MPSETLMKHLWWRFWWADSNFENPGLHIWAFKQNIRIAPLARVLECCTWGKNYVVGWIDKVMDKLTNEKEKK